MSQHRRWRRYDRSKPANAWHAIDDLREAVDSLFTADEIAVAVTEKLRNERLVTLTVFQKTLGGLSAAAIIATAVHSWFG